MKTNRFAFMDVNGFAQTTAMGYLLLPFVIFCFGWYHPLIGILAAGVSAWIIYQMARARPANARGECFPLKRWAWAAGLTGAWVLLSGIGGYAFQNPDFHTRNAIFNDLIQYSWPVTYASQGKPLYTLVYYIGYWLPAALVGKVLGRSAADFALFLWTWLGVFLVVSMVAARLKTSPLPAALLLIFFSGIDAFPVLIFQLVKAYNYPTLWPPVQHLEWWAHSVEFSAFTTQLYWVFNQAVPAWISILLLMNGAPSRRIFLVWSLCFFFAPLPAVGLLPFVLLKGGLPLLHASGQGRESLVKAGISLLREGFSVENILGGGLVFGLTTLFLQANQAVTGFYAGSRNLVFFVVTLLFIFFEAGVFWLLLARKHKKDIFFLMTGAMLLVIPFIRISADQDFVMRASIPALFTLMIWCGESVLPVFRRGAVPRVQDPPAVILLICMVLGSLTAIYEINRSIYRTTTQVICPKQAIAWLCTGADWQTPGPLEDPSELFYPEKNHPGSLQANGIGTLANVDPVIDKVMGNYLAVTPPNRLRDFIARHPEP